MVTDDAPQVINHEVGILRLDRTPDHALSRSAAPNARGNVTTPDSKSIKAGIFL